MSPLARISIVFDRRRIGPVTVLRVRIKRPTQKSVARTSSPFNTSLDYRFRLLAFRDSCFGKRVDLFARRFHRGFESGELAHEVRNHFCRCARIGVDEANHRLGAFKIGLKRLFNAIDDGLGVRAFGKRLV